VNACPNCGAENPATSKFCASCGEALETSCTNCGAQLAHGAKFCPECGTPVAAATAAEETVDPEDSRDLMASFFEAMKREIEAEGGTIEKYIGDAIMAVFGVPTAHEDDPVRAVRAARRMLERLGRWNEGRPPATQLQVRIGVNTGDVLASAPQGARGDLRVSGDAVNVAARLEQGASAGEVLVGERTARAARGAFHLEPLGTLEAKGKSQGVKAWRVIRALEVERRGIEGLRAPMVGRESQMQFLRTLYDQARQERKPQLVTILADAGVGKSRLVTEFVESLASEAKVLVGRCLPYGEGISLWPLGEILRTEAGLLHNDPIEEAKNKLDKIARTIPAAYVPDPARTAAAFAATLGLELGDDAAAIDPRQMHRELVVAWRGFLSSLASEQPLVVLIEDIHWADKMMLEILEDLAEQAEGPVLFLCPSRPDLLRTRPDWGGGRRNYSSMALDPLTREQGATLVEALLDVEHLPASLKSRMLEKSEGNPFYLEEIIRHLIDEGLLVRNGDRWQATSGLANVEIPDTVQAVILARLDLLTNDERSVAQHAAAVGRTFWLGAVSHLVGEIDLESVLRTLKRRELINERLSSSMVGETEYIFKHILIRDVAYESIPKRVRGPIHEKIATWIETTSGSRVDELAELVGHHYETAHLFGGHEEQARKAAEYYLTALKGAVLRSDHEQASGLQTKITHLVPSGPSRIEFLERIADTWGLSFSGDEAYAALNEAIKSLQASGEPDAETLARLAAKAATVPTRWRGSVQRPPTAEHLNAQISLGLSVAEDTSRARADLLAAKAMMQTMNYEPPDADGERAAREAVRIAEELSDPDLLSAVLDSAHGVEIKQGHYGGRSLALVERRLTLIDRFTDPREVTDTLNMAAWSLYMIGRYEDSEREADRAVQISLGVDTGGWVHGLSWRSSARFMLGRWDEALEDQRQIEASQAGSETSPPHYTMRAYESALLIAELRQDVDERDRLFGIHSRWHQTEGRATPAGTEAVAIAVRALIHLGRTDEAHRWIDLERNQMTALHLMAALELAAATADWSGGPAILKGARDEAESGELLALPYFADRFEGSMAAATGDSETGGALLRRSFEGFDSLKAIWEAAYSRLLLAEVLGSQDPEARTLAGSAQETFDKLGSVAESARAAAISNG
jgi:class 3 adenylate cyclase